MRVFTFGGTCYDWAYEKIGKFEKNLQFLLASAFFLRYSPSYHLQEQL